MMTWQATYHETEYEAVLDGPRGAALNQSGAEFGSGQKATCARVQAMQRKRKTALRRSLRNPIECLDQAAVRLAFSTSMWPAIASSTATLACSIDAMA